MPKIMDERMLGSLRWYFRKLMVIGSTVYSYAFIPQEELFRHGIDSSYESVPLV
jgi:hypothetical protein